MRKTRTGTYNFISEIQATIFVDESYLILFEGSFKKFGSQTENVEILKLFLASVTDRFPL